MVIKRLLCKLLKVDSAVYGYLLVVGARVVVVVVVVVDGVDGSMDGGTVGA